MKYLIILALFLVSCRDHNFDLPEYDAKIAKLKADTTQTFVIIKTWSRTDKDTFVEVENTKTNKRFLVKFSQLIIK